MQRCRGPPHYREARTSGAAMKDTYNLQCTATSNLLPSHENAGTVGTKPEDTGIQKFERFVSGYFHFNFHFPFHVHLSPNYT